jgi:hypothetical protein
VQPAEPKPPQDPKGIVPITLYVLAWVAALVTLFACKTNEALPGWMMKLGSDVDCVAMGGLAGCLYCLRGIYLNYSVKQRWDGPRYAMWYVLRPIVSCMAGGISLVFLNAGLLSLDAKPAGGSPYGYLAAAFFAGYSVERFLDRLSEIGQSTHGIKQPRSGEADGEKKGD